MNSFGNFIYRHRKATLSIWLILIIGFGYFALKLPTVLSGNGFEYDGSYIETRHILEKEFGQPKASIIVVFEKDRQTSDTEWKNFINKYMNEAKSLRNAEKVISPFENKEMMKDKFAYGLITYDKDPGALTKEIKKLNSKLKNEKGNTVTLTGEPVIIKDLNEASQNDLAKAEMIGLPIALLVLVLSLGGLIAASIPIIIGIISILITMGIVYFFSYETDLSIFILNIIPMIGLALSIDFALLFINRYKEEAKTKSIKESIQITIATAGRSIVFSGLCVFIGLSGLLFIQIDIFQNVAVGGMTVVLVSVVSALTFLPAILSLLGNKIYSLPLLKMKSGNGGWKRFAQFVMKRPVIMVLAALSILIIGLMPAREMNLAIPGVDALPENYPSRLAYESFQEHFVDDQKSDENKVVMVLESKGDILESDNLEKAYSIVRSVEKDSLTATVDSPFSRFDSPAAFLQFIQAGDKAQTAPLLGYYIRNNKMLVNIYLKPDTDSTEARSWVKKWAEKNLALESHFGGINKFEQEIFHEIFKKAPYGLLLILISTFFILMAAFRSLLIPIKAILMNILSLGSTFGIVVWIFQKGHFGMDSADIALVLPVFVFSLVFGLSMDYEVFLISRIQEYYLKTGDNSTATIEGLTSTSKIITSAAAIMIVVTGAFAFTGVMPVKQLGVGIAIAIFIDATIVRMILVPALMKLLGDWNWWFFGKEKKKITNTH